MKTVILIREENHGLIGCVASEKDVMPWLTRENWINQYTEIYNLETHDYETIKDRYGLTWFQELSKMDLYDLTEALDENFTFQYIEVWSAS